MCVCVCVCMGACVSDQYIKLKRKYWCQWQSWSIDMMNDNGLKLPKERSIWYLARTITDADYAGDIALLTNTPTRAETLHHSLEWAAASIGLHVDADKTKYMCFSRRGDISTLNGSSLKLVNKFTYRGNNISLTENDINTRLEKAWTALDRLSVMWKSDPTDKIKRNLFQAAVISILLYGCTTWRPLHKILLAILNKSWRQHSTK